MMDFEGLKWTCKQAVVKGCDSFQTDEGEHMAYIKLAFFGGLSTIMIDHNQIHKFKSHLGKVVSCGGDLMIEIKKTGTKASFGIDFVEPVLDEKK